MELENQNRSIELCTRVVTTESFIEEAKAIYGDMYNYDKVIYKNRNHRVVVTCPVHGDFDIFAREHLDGKGCPKCAKGEKFLGKLRNKFGDIFGLESFIYEDSQTPVSLICGKHGIFTRLPNSILSSTCGCPECGNEKSKNLQEKSHEEALKRQELIKKQKDEDRAHYEAERLRQWKLEIERNKEERENCLEFWEEKPKRASILYEAGEIMSPWNVYTDQVEEHIEVIKRQRKWQISEYKKYLLSEDDAQKLEFYCPGSKYYKFPNEAPNAAEIQYFKENIESPTWTMEYSLSHRGCFVTFQGNDLIIREEEESNVYVPSSIIPPSSRHFTRTQVVDLTNIPDSFVGIDFETLYSQRVSACSVGMVKYKNGTIVDRYYSLIKPPFEYPGKCGKALTWIHGFTEEMLVNERDFSEILPEMEAFVEDLPLVAHNASVERCCIRDAANYYHTDTCLDYEHIRDTLPISYKVEEIMGIGEDGPGTHTLDSVCRRFGIEELHHHNALDDAEMCGNLFLCFAKILNSNEDIVIDEIKLPKQNNAKYNEEDKIQRSDLENVVENPFKDCGVVLTGFSTKSSQDYGHKLKELGAKVCTGVSSKTRWLICGANAGPSKLAKAQSIGAKIINEEEFIKILNDIK